jgi:uncharacterized protein with NRDE domain
MCTVSWAPTPGGYTLYFNRDERRTRGIGHPPSAAERDGVRFLAPIDPDAGGTWIGVNERGVAVGLLNRYHETPLDTGGPRTSRGLLVLSVLPAPSAAAVLDRVAGRNLAEFQPFTICAVDLHRQVHLADWNGTELRTERTARAGMIRTSSGRDQAEAERIRAAAERELVIGPSDLDRFHRSHFPERGPFSVCMHRPEAETASLTTIEVSAGRARLEYVAGSPCRGAAPVTAALALRSETGG